MRRSQLLILSDELIEIMKKIGINRRHCTIGGSMILIGSGIVNVGTRIASGGDNNDLVELAEEEYWIEKSENLREEFGEVKGERRPEERVGVECDHEEADVICVILWRSWSSHRVCCVCVRLNWFEISYFLKTNPCLRRWRLRERIPCLWLWCFSELFLFLFLSKLLITSHLIHLF